MTLERVRHVQLGDLTVRIEVEIEPTDRPWDGDEPLDPGYEGWYFCACAVIDLGKDSGIVSGHASVDGVWVQPDAAGRAYLDEVAQDMMDEAVHDLKKELARLAKGESVNRERRRQCAARRVLDLVPVQEVCES